MMDCGLDSDVGVEICGNRKLKVKNLFSRVLSSCLMFIPGHRCLPLSKGIFLGNEKILKSNKAFERWRCLPLFRWRILKIYSDPKRCLLSTVLTSFLEAYEHCSFYRSWGIVPNDKQ